MYSCTGSGEFNMTGAGSGEFDLTDISLLNWYNTRASITLNWHPPSENTDNTTLNDLAGYKLYYGFSPTALTNKITINDAYSSTYTINNLYKNTSYYVSMTAINRHSVESERSNIIKLIATE